MNKINRYLGLHLTAIASVIALGLWMSPGVAGDFFRDRNPHKIGKHTEAAFTAFFAEGNYPEGQRQLELAKQTEPDEPLVYTLLAAFAYLNQDERAARDYSRIILDKSAKLADENPLRSKIYTSIGHLVDSGTKLKNTDSLSVLNKLRLVLENIDEAEKISPRDPELNLIKGTIDLFLALNIPFSDPEAAIARLDKYAAPSYAADRAIAIGYRDLKRYSNALEYVNKAIASAPKNPELYYLKAQIQTRLGDKRKSDGLLQEANDNFQIALEKSNRLPKNTVADIAAEKCANQVKLERQSLNCRSIKASIEKEPGLWGPAKVPEPK